MDMEISTRLYSEMRLLQRDVKKIVVHVGTLLDTSIVLNCRGRKQRAHDA